ncbi:hypothetical protein IC582_009618 [Cucumis melo]
MSNSLNNRSGPPRWVAALEHTRADEYTVTTELHHQRCICRRGYTTSGKLNHRKPAELLRLQHQIIWRSDLFGEGKDLIVVHVPQQPDIPHHGPHVSHSLNDIAGTGLTLGSDHCRPFTNTPQRLTEVTAATDKRNAEVVLVDVVFFISESKNFALIHIINTNGLKNLSFNEMTDSSLRHDRNRNSLFDFLDELWVTHSGDTALGSDVCRNSFKSHDGASSSLFGDTSLLCVDDVHNYTAAEHLSQSNFHREGGLFRLRESSVTVHRYNTGSCHCRRKKK